MEPYSINAELKLGSAQRPETRGPVLQTLVLFQQEYTVDIVDPNEHLALVECSYVAACLLPGAVTLTDEELTAYNNQIVTPVLYPYVRELVRDIMARCGVPVTLPYWRPPTPVNPSVAPGKGALGRKAAVKKAAVKKAPPSRRSASS